MPATTATPTSVLNLSSSLLLGGSDVSGPSLIHCRNPTQVRDAVFHLVHKGTFLPQNNPFRNNINNNNNNGTPSPSPSSSCGFATAAVGLAHEGSGGVVHSTPPPSHLPPPRSPPLSSSSVMTPPPTGPPSLERSSFVVLLPLPSKYPQEPVSRHNPVDALLLLHEDTECVVRIDIQHIIKRYGGPSGGGAMAMAPSSSSLVPETAEVRDHPLAPLLHLLGDHTIIKVVHDSRGFGDAIRSDVAAFDEVVVEPIVDTCLLPMYFGFVDSYAPRTQRGVVKIPSLSSTLRFFGLPGLAVPPHLYPENGVGNAPTAVVFSKVSTSSKRSSRRTSPVLSPVKSPPCPVERTFSNSSVASKDAQATPTKAPRARTIASNNNNSTCNSNINNNNFARPPPLPPMPSVSSTVTAPIHFSTPPPLSGTAPTAAPAAVVSSSSRRSTSPVISTTNTVPMLTAYQHCYLSSLQMIFTSQFNSNEILSNSFTRSAIIFREATQAYYNSVGKVVAGTSSSSVEEGAKREAASEAGSSSSTTPVLKAQATSQEKKRRQPVLPPPDSSAPLQGATEEIVAASMRYFNILSSYVYKGLADASSNSLSTTSPNVGDGIGDGADATHLRSLLHFRTPNYLPYGVLLPLGCSSKILPTTTQNIGGEYKLDADEMTVDAMQLRSHSDHLIASVDSCKRETTLKSRMAVSAALAFSEAMGISSQTSSPNRIIIGCHNLQIVGHNKFSPVKKNPHMVSFNGAPTQQPQQQQHQHGNRGNHNNKRQPKLLMKIPEKLLKGTCQVGPIVRRCQGCYLPFEYFPIAVNVQGGFGLDAARGVITATCLGCVERELPCEFFRRGICVRSCGCCSEPPHGGSGDNACCSGDSSPPLPAVADADDKLSSQYQQQQHPLLVPSCDYRHVLQPCPVGRQCTTYVKEMSQEIGTLLSVSTTGNCPYTHEGLVKKVTPCAVGTPLACHKAPHEFPTLLRGEFKVIISKALSMPLPPMPSPSQRQSPPPPTHHAATSSTSATILRKIPSNAGTPNRPSPQSGGGHHANSTNNINNGVLPPTAANAPLTAERLHAHQEQTRLESNNNNNNHSRQHSVGCVKSQSASSNANSRRVAAAAAVKTAPSPPVTSILKTTNPHLQNQSVVEEVAKHKDEVVAENDVSAVAQMIRVDDVEEELADVILRGCEGGNLPSYATTDGTGTATPSRASSSALNRRKRRGKGHRSDCGSELAEGGVVPDKVNATEATPAAISPSTPPVLPSPHHHHEDPITTRTAPTVSSAKGGSTKMPHSPSAVSKRNPSGELAMLGDGGVVLDVMDHEISIFAEKHSQMKGSSSARGSATPSSCVSSSTTGGVNGTRRRRRRIHQAHKTAMAAVEAGHDIPPSCLAILNAHGRPLPDKDVWYFDDFEENDAINGEDALHYCGPEASTYRPTTTTTTDTDDGANNYHTTATANNNDSSEAADAVQLQQPMTPPTTTASTTLPHCVSDFGSRSGRGVTFSLTGQDGAAEGGAEDDGAQDVKHTNNEGGEQGEGTTTL